MILSKTIPNMLSPLEDVERRINIYEISINSKVEQLYVGCEIEHKKDNIDISLKMNSVVREWYINNSKTIYKRDFKKISEGDMTGWLPLPNPNYINELETPNEDKYDTAPAFTYLLEEVLKKYPALLFVILEAYIEENYADGWFD